MAKNPADDVLFEVGGEDEPPLAKAPAGRSKVFRHYDPTHSFFLPPSLDDWLPEDHTARFIAEVVDNQLDLTAIYDSYVEAAGAPPYDPSMMLKLLLFAYSTGVTSSREMERRCHVDVVFRWLSANTAPDYRSISWFRRRHLVAVDDLFCQVLALCGEAGLVRVALDGTKLRASASRHKAMSYDHLGPKIEQLQAEVAGAKAAPSKKAQRNFTDPESRMMKTNAGFRYCYNAQAVVDEESQVVLAAEVTQQANDIDQFLSMVAVTEANLDDADIDGSPDVVLADAGYCSEQNFQQIADAEISAHIATGRIKHGERVPDAPRGRIPKNATQRERMARRLRTKAGRARQFLDLSRRCGPIWCRQAGPTRPPVPEVWSGC
jgi:transposase